jgi:hypothetical protein
MANKKSMAALQRQPLINFGKMKSPLIGITGLEKHQKSQLLGIVRVIFSR